MRLYFYIQMGVNLRPLKERVLRGKKRQTKEGPQQQQWQDAGGDLVMSRPLRLAPSHTIQLTEGQGSQSTTGLQSSLPRSHCQDCTSCIFLANTLSSFRSSLMTSLLNVKDDSFIVLPPTPKLWHFTECSGLHDHLLPPDCGLLCLALHEYSMNTFWMSK